MSVEVTLPPERGASPATGLAPPAASLDVTLGLLRQFYYHVKPLQQHFPASCQLLQEGDSDAFKQLVEQTMVAGLAEDDIGELRVEPIVGSDVGMRDVSSFEFQSGCKALTYWHIPSSDPGASAHSHLLSTRSGYGQ